VLFADGRSAQVDPVEAMRVSLGMAHSADVELTGEHSRNEDEYALYQSGGGICGSRAERAGASSLTSRRMLCACRAVHATTLSSGGVREVVVSSFRLFGDDRNPVVRRRDFDSRPAGPGGDCDRAVVSVN
jgi:hypothetical protein